jgi:hypothetical protein
MQLFTPFELVSSLFLLTSFSIPSRILEVVQMLPAGAEGLSHFRCMEGKLSMTLLL